MNPGVDLPIRRKVAVVLALFPAGLLVSGYLRLLQLGAAEPPAFASFATEIYIAITVLAAIAHGSSNSIGIMALYWSG
jgi:hypothetical protein